MPPRRSPTGSGGAENPGFQAMDQTGMQNMRYVSTRGGCPPHSFPEAVMTGLAPDGGLFLPESLPDFSASLEGLQECSFQELFKRLAAPFIDGSIPDVVLDSLVERSYAVFDHPDVTPVLPVGGLYVCELFHGPTLAFKDVALQFLVNLFEHLLGRREARLTVLGATSGDTGSAAIHALKGRKGIEVFILYPHGRVTPIQEMQMTTVEDANIHPIAIEGTFDDAQRLVKELFNDHAFNAEVSLGAVNSINWVRVMAQITYYFFAYFRVVEFQQGAGNDGKMRLGDPLRFSVPTGNFGHVYAGLMARGMGLPVEKLILATNANAILHDLVASGVYRRGEVRQTLSPSMDIQLASNFERYLFDLAGRDSGRVNDWLDELSRKGKFTLASQYLAKVEQDFISERVDDRETVETIRSVHAESGYLLDPHSAVGFRAGEKHRREGMPTIAMVTAHPAKFSDAIRQAIGREPELPPSLARLAGLAERKQVLPGNPDALRKTIRETLAARS